MAKVVIVFEDVENGEVRTTVTPPCEEIVRRARDGHTKISSAEGYALRAVTAVVIASHEEKKKRQKEEGIDLWTP